MQIIQNGLSLKLPKPHSFTETTFFMNSSRKSMLLRAAFMLVLVCFVWPSASCAREQKINRINYRLAMSRPQSHLFEVTIEVELDGKASAESIDFQMPRWSPGRYA